MSLRHLVSAWAVSIAFCSGICAPAQGQSPPRKKFVELGWDIPNTAYLRHYYAQMERTAPFDGVMFKVEFKDNQGRLCSSESVWDKTPWKREWLQEAFADLQACKFSKFTDNFVRFNATPGDLDWADEASWAALSDKAGLCAWLMRNSGMKGLAIDFESYGAAQFRFDPAKGKTFADTASLARKRGAQCVQAIAKEFPHAVLLTLFVNSINFRAGANEYPSSILAASHYGLLPAFLDGKLDGAPPMMIVVDGCENGYYMDSAEEYLCAANGMRSWNGPAIRMVSPENRAKYRQQVQAGFGFYLDMFINDKTNRYYRGPLNGSRLARLERNLVFARDAADEYVWIYGEQCRWWNQPQDLSNKVAQARLWEEALPGVTLAISFARDPISAAREKINADRKAGVLTNLAVNPQFSEPGTTNRGALPKGFTCWQNEKEPAGSFAWEEIVGLGSARAIQVKWGCFMESHPVKPGEAYAIEVQNLNRGIPPRPSLVIRWQTAEQRWTQEGEDRTFNFMYPAEGNWRKAFGVVTVPAGTSRLLILLSVTGQVSDEDVCWFDNLALYRIR